MFFAISGAWISVCIHYCFSKLPWKYIYSSGGCLLCAATSVECITGEYTSSTSSIEGHSKIPVNSWMLSSSGRNWEKTSFPVVNLFDDDHSTDWQYEPLPTIKWPILNVDENAVFWSAEKQHVYVWVNRTISLLQKVCCGNRISRIVL